MCVVWSGGVCLSVCHWSRAEYLAVTVPTQRTHRRPAARPPDPRSSPHSRYTSPPAAPAPVRQSEHSTSSTLGQSQPGTLYCRPIRHNCGRSVFAMLVDHQHFNSNRNNQTLRLLVKTMRKSKELYTTITVSYTHLTLPTILRV